VTANRTTFNFQVGSSSSAYLNPEPLTKEEATRIYSPNAEADARELAMARAAMRSIRTARKN